ncbi:MAG: MBL fold metallo-hydrolase [Lysobacterales bacterium]|jgi:glyoxylase-like metal-dependent hydrolase (beta-lactamase superfamily II)|nr:MAG: MBL fold metallo-hydrolase [Xanthomonadales bacterium]
MRMRNRCVVASLMCAAFLPAVVAAATDPPQAASSEVRELGPGLHLYGGGDVNTIVWTGADGTALVGGWGDDAIAAARQVSQAPIRYVVATHWHPAASAGDAGPAAGATLIAQDALRTLMAAPHRDAETGQLVSAAARGALPVITFDDTLMIHLNGSQLDVLHVADARGPGDVVAWWPAQNVAHVGDLYDPAGFPFVDLARGGTLAGIVAALETVLSRADDATVIVPGHGPVADRAGLGDYRGMLVAVGRRVAELVGQGLTLEEVLAAEPAGEYERRYGGGRVAADRFVRLVYGDLTRRR